MLLMSNIRNNQSLMKESILTLLFLASGYFCLSQIEIPSPSPEGGVFSKVGLTQVKVEYARPKVRGRKIFGSGEEVLLPYGQLWRTGAGNGTFLSLSTKAKIAGKVVESGTYLILTIPDSTEWTFILYNDLNIDGANLTPNYKVEHEVLKTKVKSRSLQDEVQTLSFQITDISDDNTTANIEFSWSYTAFSVPIEVSFNDIVLDDIELNMVVEPINYIRAAQYYYTYDKDQEQALEWVNSYLELEGHNDDFWYMYLKAQILTKLGRKKEAIEVANQTIELAQKSPRGDLGYIKRSEAILDTWK